MTAPSLGDILYLASYVIKLSVEAITTMIDTPNQFSAGLGIMGDPADLDVSALVGPAGPAGSGSFQLRLQELPIVNTSEDLPTLTNEPEDIGKYWLIDTLDEYGHVVGETAWIWYGTEYRTYMMGTFGPPGPIPDIDIDMGLIPAPQDSYVLTSGSTLNPSWDFQLAIPPGPAGPPNYLALFPDVDLHTNAPESGCVLAFTGTYTDGGAPIWVPLSIDMSILGPYSMPESAFNSYTGVSQQAAIGSFALPTQAFNWTPIVWGHIGGAGIQLSSDPFMIGCQVLLGNATTGVQVARGLGNTLGEVNIMPHYSTSAATTAAVTPNNTYAIVPAEHVGDEGTLYVNLYNDGQTGAYDFSPADAQLFVLVVPLNPPYTAITTPG